MHVFCMILDSFMPPDNSVYLKIIFFTCVVGTQKNRLIEAILLSTQSTRLNFTIFGQTNQLKDVRPGNTQTQIKICYLYGVMLCSSAKYVITRIWFIRGTFM